MSIQAKIFSIFADKHATLTACGVVDFEAWNWTALDVIIHPVISVMTLNTMNLIQKLIQSNQRNAMHI